MDIKVDGGTLILAAFTKALSETAPEEIAKVMTECLMERADKNSYARSSATVLESLVESAVRRLANQVIEEVVSSYRPQIEAQVRKAVNGQTVAVTIGGSYGDKGINVAVVLGDGGDDAPRKEGES